jgi:hypothetical protein
MRRTAMKHRIVMAVLAAAVWLAAAPAARAQYVAGGAYRNPYTGGSYNRAAAYNPYTGGAARASSGYNPYTGTSAAGRSYHNPYTGTTTRVGAAYNPYTGRGAVGVTRTR